MYTENKEVLSRVNFLQKAWWFKADLCVTSQIGPGCEGVRVCVLGGGCGKWRGKEIGKLRSANLSHLKQK